MKKTILLIVLICSFLFIPQILFAGKVYVAGTKVNIRPGPGTSFEVIAMCLRINQDTSELKTRDIFRCHFTE